MSVTTVLVVSSDW